MLYVITITLENICEGKEDTKLYQRFFKSIGSAKKQLSELRKKILDKGYNYAFSGKIIIVEMALFGIVTIMITLMKLQ